MLSDDTYRKQLQRIISALESWAGEMSAAARIEHGPTDGAWRISAAPHAETACPFELVARPDQKFDIMIGGQTYEELGLEALGDLPEIVRAIGEGRVWIRRWSSTTTDIEYNVETVVDLPGGVKWRVERPNPHAPLIAEAELLSWLTSFAPYRR